MQQEKHSREVQRKRDIMIFKPAKLGKSSLPEQELVNDKKTCRKIGPCGVGKKALYLNSFYIDRRYYVPISSVSRVFKRVAMSKGGFSGKGIFATIPYLVVVYDNGVEKQCNFKVEEQVDKFIAHVAQEFPDIKLVSKEAEKRLAAKEKERAERKLPVLTEEAIKTKQELERAKKYLEQKPELSLELSQSARRKRAFLQGKSSYKWVALAITLLGAVALVYGIVSLLKHGEFAIYFTLLGLAAIFLFSGASVLPTSRNNRRAILKRADVALTETKKYIEGYTDFPVPARYAHPIVLQRMIRAVEEGKAESVKDALESVKEDLKALNSNVEVEQEEYEEVVAIKPMFLNENYC